MATTADDLVTIVLDECFWPTSGAKLSNAEILRRADLVLLRRFLPALVKANAGYYLHEADYSITSGKYRYRLPSRIYGPVVDVVYVDASATDPQDEEQSIPMLQQEELGRPEMFRASPVKHGFYHAIDGDFIRLIDTPEVTEDTLRIKYYRRPNDLVLSANCLAVLDATLLSTSQRITFSGDPSSLWNTGDKIDVIGNGNAHSALVDNNAILSFPSSVSLQLTDEITGRGTDWGVAPGDWVASTGETPIVQLPDHMLGAFTSHVAVACLSAAGEVEEARLKMIEAKEAFDDAIEITAPRSEAEPNTVVCANSVHRTTSRYGNGGAW